MTAPDTTLPHAVIFDLDGVITDTASVHFSACVGGIEAKAHQLHAAAPRSVVIEDVEAGVQAKRKRRL